MNVPDEPDEQSVKAIMMELPRPPMFPVLRAGAPTINGRVYPPELLAAAVERAKRQVEQRTLMVHMPSDGYATPLEMKDVCGVVEHIEFVDDQVMVEIRFLHERMASIASALRFATTGKGILDEESRVTDYTLEAIVVCNDPASRVTDYTLQGIAVGNEPDHPQAR